MLTGRELQTLRNQGNEAEVAADEIALLRADVAALRDANDRWSGVLAAERERCAPLISELRMLAERCEWPDGDAAQVIAQLWAEEWVRKIDGPNEG